MHRTGAALIVIGLILLASPLYMPTAAVLYLVNPGDVWNLPVSPNGSPSQPEAIVSSATTVYFAGRITRAGSGWELPGSCASIVFYARVYDGSALRTTVTFTSANGEVQSEEGGTVCRFSKSVPIAGTFEKDKVYTVKWSLEVRDTSGNVLGTINKPDDSAFILKDVPTVKWYINNVEAGPASTLVVTPPITFKMTVVSGDQSMISSVKVRIVKGTTTLAQLTLSKTGTGTWETTWQTTEKGRVSVGGYFTVGSIDYFTLNIALDLGDGGGNGGDGRLGGLTPLQLVGILSILAGSVMVVMRRD